MKKLLLPVLLLLSFAASAQLPGSTLINSRYEWLGGSFKQLKVPAYTDTANYPTWLPKRAGDIMIDTAGADAGLYIRYGQPPIWIRAGVGGSGSDSTSYLAGTYPIQLTQDGDTVRIAIDPAYAGGDSLVFDPASFLIDGDTLRVIGGGGGIVTAGDGISVAGSAVAVNSTVARRNAYNAFTPTLTATANDQNLIAIFVDPTYNNGAFSNIKHTAFKFFGDIDFSTDATISRNTTPHLFLSDAETKVINYNGELKLTTGYGGDQMRILNNGDIIMSTTNYTASGVDAQLELRSPTKGFLPNRGTQSQREALTPGNGMLYFQTDGTKGLYYYEGGEWRVLNTGLLDPTAGRVPYVNDYKSMTTKAGFDFDPANDRLVVNKIRATQFSGGGTQYAGYDNDGSLVAVAAPTGSKSQYILFSGQSNAGGYNTGNYDTASNPKVLGWNPTTNAWVKLQRGVYPMGSFTPGVSWSAGGYGSAYDTATNAAFHFAKRLQEQSGDTIKVFLFGWGGQSINNWLGSGTNFEYMRDEIALAGNPRINYFGWQQGEADDALSDTAYLARMNALTARLDSQSWFDKSVPIYIGTVLRTIIHMNAIQKAIGSGMYDKRYTLIDMSNEPQMGDNLHLTSQAQYNAGNKIIQTIRNKNSLSNVFRITQADDRAVIAAHTPRIGVGILTQDSTTKVLYQFNGTDFVTFVTKDLVGRTATITENDASGTLPLRVENQAATGGTKQFTLGQMGSSGYGITDWANAALFEGNGSGGLTMSAFAGSINFQVGGGRGTIGKWTTAGNLYALNNIGAGISSPIARLHLAAGTTSVPPLMFTTGTALGSVADGAMEYHASHLYFTIGSTRYQLDQQTGAVVATSAELNTGTDNAKFASALALEGSKYLDNDGSKTYIATAGSANTYTATFSPAFGAYVSGMVINVMMNVANTGASTINVNGLGAKSIVKGVSTALASGDLPINRAVTLIYDGTNFQVQSWYSDVLKANLASPTFTGTPTLPTGTIATTQTAGNSTTAVATTAFVTTANNLKANIASPTFTGTPAGPSTPVGTSTTQLATSDQVTGSMNKVRFVTVAGSTSAALTDRVLLADASAGALTISLPSNATAFTSPYGMILTIIKTDATANTVTADANGSEVINGALTKVLNTQYATVTIANSGGGWFIISQ